MTAHSILCGSSHMQPSTLGQPQGTEHGNGMTGAIVTTMSKVMACVTGSPFVSVQLSVSAGKKDQSDEKLRLKERKEERPGGDGGHGDGEDNH
ncbi:hypothetical protein BaRGS_00002570 [Batillaria attramentaria]|uniref:Uncharacterized protein n=1 Tax=Batillaria attramentaria TaxID=370345 RepID=A0ABD0M4X2_9CAEN